MKKVHIVYVKIGDSHSSYHCRTYLDLAIGDTVLMAYDTCSLKLATVIGIKDKDNEMVRPWIIEKLSKEEIRSRIEKGCEMADLDKRMMAKYEEFVRNEGFEELAERDAEMSALLSRYRELSDEI